MRRPAKRAAPPNRSRRLASGLAQVLARGAALLRAHPTQAVGTAAFAALLVCVSVNALVNQTGRHKHPILSTRAGGADAAASAEDSSDGLMSVPFVVEVQTALADAGYYSATIDGRPGKATAAAIRTYQGDHNLPVDGTASPKLLAAIRQVAHPSPTATAPEIASRMASLAADEGVADRGSDAARAVPPTPAGGQAPGDLVRRIQSGLAAANVAELKADGIFGSHTESAIRTFEASQGLDVTGRPSVALLNRLDGLSAEKR